MEVEVVLVLLCCPTKVKKGPRAWSVLLEKKKEKVQTWPLNRFYGAADCRKKNAASSSRTLLCEDTGPGLGYCGRGHLSVLPGKEH